MIPYGKHEITKEDLDCVIEALKGDFITQGPLVPRFEENFSKYLGVPYSTVTSNGTAALHISVSALGIGPGDEVITTPMTFCATANAALYQGAEVKFVDIDEKTLNIN